MHKWPEGIYVSRETEEKLSAFVSLLEKWNPRINLVSSKDIGNVWSRHVLDSLQLVPLIQGQSRFIDMGSGGGLSCCCGGDGNRNTRGFG